MGKRYVAIVHHKDERGQEASYQYGDETMDAVLSVVGAYAQEKFTPDEFEPSFSNGDLLRIELITMEEFLARGWSEDDAIDIHTPYFAR